MPVLPLPTLPAQSNVLLDANVLIYALSSQSTQCSELLARCDREEVSAFTTVEVVNEVAHRMMLAEAFAKGLINRPNVGAIKSKPDVVRALTEYRVQVERILASNMLILELTESRLRRAQRVRDAHGLLTTDSTIAAAALELGIDQLATHDGDFAVVSSLRIYAPTDLP